MTSGAPTGLGVGMFTEIIGKNNVNIYKVWLVPLPTPYILNTESGLSVKSR